MEGIGMQLWLLLLLVCVGGCAASHPDVSDSSHIPPPAQRRPSAPSTVIGYSVQGRPIELYAFGSGPRPVLVLGAIHGNEPTSADVTHGLINDLQNSPQLAGGVPVVIIPVANPDGLASKTRTNANQIDCNRNFPAANWKNRSGARGNFGGQASASEPETAAIMQTVERLQPRLIISVHSMDKPCNNYDGPAQHIAELMSRYNRYPATPTIGYPTPGSMGSWAGIDQQIPMITLELPRSLPSTKAWPNNRDAVLAAIVAMKR